MKKSKVSSAMLKKRNILESPIVNTDNALTINSPLITNRSKNRLQDLSKAYFEENKTSTPSMPPRSSELVFNKESSIEEKPQSEWQRSFQFRSLDRPQLTKKPSEHSKFYTNPENKSKPIEPLKTFRPVELPKLLKNPSSTNKNTTDMDSIPKSKEHKNLEICIPSKQDKINEAIAHNQDSKLAVTFTPGINKRRLKRETNLAIGKIEPNENAVTQKKIEKEETKETPNINSLESTSKQKEDPLSKFFKTKEEPASKVKDSLNFLKQLGGVVPFTQRKSEEKKDLFKIPEFKSKQSDAEMVKSKSEKQDIGVTKLQRDDFILAEIPSYKEKMLSRRMSETNSESSQEKK